MTTPFKLAVQAVQKNNRSDLRKLLNASPELAEEPKLLNQAALLGHVEVAMLLLSCGSDPNAAVTSHEWYRPLHRAIEHRGHVKNPGHRAVVEGLLKAGASLTERSTWMQLVPLSVAGMVGDREFIDLLLQAGAEKNLLTARTLKSGDFLEKACIYQGSMAAKNHQSDTPKSFLTVPGHTRLFRRDGTYYMRAKVPLRIRDIVGKTEIRVSLRTKEYREAISRVKIESIKVDDVFSSAKRKSQGGPQKTGSKLSPDEIVWWASKFFVGLERRDRLWLDTEGCRLSLAEQEDIAENLKDESALASGSLGPGDTTDLDRFLSDEGSHLGVEKGGDDYKEMAVNFARARVEHLWRLAKTLKNEPYTPEAFKDLNAETILSPLPKRQKTLGAFLDEFLDHRRKAKAENTYSAYQVPARLLKESVGESTLLANVSREQVKRVCELLKKTPVNAVQRYPGLTVLEAIEEAEKRKDTRLISVRTQHNYHTLLVAIFNEACEEGLISENPAKSRRIREMFQLSENRRKKPLFTAGELQAIFKAPLYTGCVDDVRNYAQRGPNVIRRGRFWVPLIALFNGLRMNEACQLYAHDIGEDDEGVPFIQVDEDVDGERASDKHLKGSASRRIVPIHPELLRMGLLEFARDRQKQGKSARLFPELKLAEEVNRYSKVFSKWFSRFAMLACDKKPQATFHSLRHHFRSAFATTDVRNEVIEALGGWSSKGSSEREYRHYKLSDLRDALSKVKYSEVNFSHLYVD